MSPLFQLVFRDANGHDRVETRANNGDGEPELNGELIVDGTTYVVREVEWLFTREDIGDTKRFICTLVVEPVDDSTTA
jgi:hypothetical protein